MTTRDGRPGTDGEQDKKKAEVIPIRRKARGDREEKISPAVVEHELCQILKGERPANPYFLDAPLFPYVFKVMRSSENTGAVLLAVAKNTAKPIATEVVAGKLKKYLARLPYELKEYNLTHRRCQAVVEYYLASHVDFTELPKTLGFKSDPELVMRRLDFDPIVCTADTLQGFAPMFADMLSRISNAHALCARLGSLYDPHADRKQAVWVSGPKDSGKSDFSWLIRELAGETDAGLLSSEDLKTPYWKAQLVGCRAAVVIEAATTFIRSDQFKAVTGDDDHSINQKNQKIYVAKLAALFFMFSNNEPKIPSDDALIERIIDCRITPVPPDIMMPKEIVREALTKELPYIAGYCQAIYQERPSGTRIPCNIDDLIETVDRFEARYTDVLEHLIIAEIGAELAISRFWNEPELLKFQKPEDRPRLEALLVRKYGAKEHRASYRTDVPGIRKRPWVYQNIRLRTEEERRHYSDEKGGVTSE